MRNENLELRQVGWQKGKMILKNCLELGGTWH